MTFLEELNAIDYDTEAPYEPSYAAADEADAYDAAAEADAYAEAAYNNRG
jgi:hypothetical protein|tara:strand:- start:298 stop:447 length:150 start_codon:yes stop_codon:yes gene_type:complete